MSVLVKAPGRVNLIGEHTDYNDGLVLPIAIDRHLRVEASRLPGREIRLHSEAFGETHSFSLDSPRSEGKTHWSDHVKGVAQVMAQRGHRIDGAALRIAGDVPMEAGLGSSAALEVAACVALVDLFDLPLSLGDVPEICRQAENEFVGVQSGIMDPLVSVFAEAGSALFLDCRDLRFAHVPIPPEIAILVVNSRVKRSLSSSEYNLRGEQCEEGVRLLREAGVDAKSLRDVSFEDFDKHGDRLPPVVRRRCQHVVQENQRVMDAKEALTARALVKFGSLINESHDSLRDLFEVSRPELDRIVDIARQVDGVLGARLTGAGFGGCVLCLVRPEERSELRDRIRNDYEQATGIVPEFYAFTPGDGARLLNAS